MSQPHRIARHFEDAQTQDLYASKRLRPKTYIASLVKVAHLVCSHCYIRPFRISQGQPFLTEGLRITQAGEANALCELGTVFWVLQALC